MAHCRWPVALMVLAALGSRADDGRLVGLSLRPSLIITEAGKVTGSVDLTWSRPFETLSDRRLKGVWPYLGATFALEDGITRLVGGAEGYFSSDYTGSLRRAVVWGLGVETEQQFANPSLLGELGYKAVLVPPGSRPGMPDPRRTGIGLDGIVAAQVGYKFSGYTSTLDTSSERPDSMLWRLRGEAGLHFRPRGVPLLLEATAGVWYDIANSDWYSQIDAGVRWNLGRGFFIDVWRYQNGYGAPTFNTGDQHNFGVSWEY